MLTQTTSLLQAYQAIRRRSEQICAPLQAEDYVVQPIVDVSPPKWHLGHTTWFFETFILQDHLPEYKLFHPDFHFVFNSYYESLGKRVVRTDRGNLSRPTVDEVYGYRAYVDAAMEQLLSGHDTAPFAALLQLGFNHEQQHQELLCTDIKYILGHNPLLPAYEPDNWEDQARTLNPNPQWIPMDAGMYGIGFRGEGFCFDNELNAHQVYLDAYRISSELITNQEYMAFIEAGGYQDFRHWHSEGWEWVKANGIQAPLYWHLIDHEWHHYTLAGLQAVDPGQPVCHISYYEAAAFAAWSGHRLPTEAEWEAAAARFDWGQRWEWTGSAYLPYPGFKTAPGAAAEYNGKFMVSQMVLRGASAATAPGHSRPSYRNFFHPWLRWQYSGIRLAH